MLIVNQSDGTYDHYDLLKYPTKYDIDSHSI